MREDFEKDKPCPLAILSWWVMAAITVFVVVKEWLS